MNQRLLILTFTGCTVTFAGVWAMTAPTPRPASGPVAAAAPTVMYADCDAVRASGAAPLRASQPGYRPALDPNMNGIACETVGAPAPGMTAAAPSATDPGIAADATPPPPPPPPSLPDRVSPPPPGAPPPHLPPLT